MQAILFFIAIIVNHATTDGKEDIQDIVAKEQLSFILIVKEGCSECEKAEKLWNDLKLVFKNFISFGILRKESGIPKGYETNVFPSVKLYSQESKKISNYKGPITAEDIFHFGTKEINSLIKGAYKAKGFTFRDSYVVYLGNSNFTKEVEDSSEPVLVEFFAPWCGHCKALAPAYEKAAKKLHGKARLVAVDCTVNEDLARKFGIKGFPTLKYIQPRTKDVLKAIDYGGARTAEAIISWVESQIAAHVPPPELIQVTNSNELETECFQKGLCVITILPNRLDSDSASWKKYINQLKSTIDSTKSRNFGWVWFEGGVHSDFEEAFEVGGFGYPVVMAVNYQKKVFAVMKNSFDSNSIKKFVDSLGSRSVITNSLPDTVPYLKETVRWEDTSASRSEDL